MSCCNSIEDNFRFNYINERLCQTFDLIVEVEEAIQSAEIELEIAMRLEDGEEADVIRKEMDLLREGLEQLEEKESVLEDMFDEELINVLRH